MHRLLLPLALLLAAPAFAQTDFSGDWSGTLEAAGQQLTIVLHLSESDGAYRATMDVPAQGAYGLPADSAAVSGDTLLVSFAGLGAAFEGVAAGEGAALEGEWQQGGRAFPLTLTPYAPAPEAEAPKDGEKYARGDLSGDWQGAIALPGGGEVRLLLHLVRTDDGYDAFVSGPGGERQPLETATVSGRTVTLADEQLGIEVTGTVSGDEAVIEGEWRQQGQKVPVTFTRG